MMESQVNYRQEFIKGIVKENPVLRLVLGTCPTLATTTSVESSLGMGIAAAIVLVCSNIVISALRKLIPAKVRIPAYIVIIATFVSIVQMLVKAYVPALDEKLGIYLPLIVVNCIILGRAEAYAGKHRVLASAVDGLGMGIGFIAALVSMGLFREILGAGAIYGQSILPESLGLSPIAILSLAPGGFFAYGLLMATANHLAGKKGKPKAELSCCGCPLNTVCSATGGLGVEALAPKPVKQVKPVKPIASATASEAATTCVTQTATGLSTSAAEPKQVATAREATGLNTKEDNV